MFPPSALANAGGLRPVRRDDPAPQAPERAPGSPRAPRERVTISEDARRLSGALTPEEQRLLAQLRSRDAEVRAHEAAHQAAGGELAGGASFTYRTGPDGRPYAVGGEVPIQLREGRTAEETIAIAQRVRRAALAPANPSPQDLSVAGAAARLEADARTRRAREAAAAYGRGREADGPAPAPQGEAVAAVEGGEEGAA